jgi:hypothetical protein
LSVVDLTEKQIPFGVGRDTVDMEEFTGVVSGVPTNVRDDFQSLAIQDLNRFIGAIHDIKELLFFVRRDGKRRIVSSFERSGL